MTRAYSDPLPPEQAAAAGPSSSSGKGKPPAGPGKPPKAPQRQPAAKKQKQLQQVRFAGCISLSHPADKFPPLGVCCWAWYYYSCTAVVHCARALCCTIVDMS
jgi:hypothetical protein